MTARPIIPGVAYAVLHNGVTYTVKADSPGRAIFRLCWALGVFPK